MRSVMHFIPYRRCEEGHRMRPVWLFGRVLRWTCDACSPPPRMVWTRITTDSTGDGDA